MPKNQYKPQSFTHPGTTLREKLEEIQMGSKEFAVRTGKPEKTITKILNGNSSITPEMAVKFEKVLKIPAHFWLNYQAKYSEYIARVKNEEEIQNAAEWARFFPYATMVKLGWIKQTLIIEEKVEALLDFFGVSNKSAWEDYYFNTELKVNFRISLKHSSEAFAISTWLRKGELDAVRLQNFPEYNSDKFRKSIDKIKKIMVEHPDNFFQKLQKTCMESGVKVIFTPGLPKAPIHGSTRWIGRNPVIQLTARYKRNDNFWFTFFHEVAHILKHGKKFISIENVHYDEEDVEKEKEADNFAIEITFSQKDEKELLKNVPITEEKIIKFAKKINTHPAMIIGRFHHKNLWHYSKGRKFIEAINLNN
jgi:HTH-type transcriptional regulator / antitoxin HigA